ncbi:transposase domain-containing protein [Rhizophagus irregularis DAOM 181602=DAOM 197198]|nr:transposase domain-containing protein [Rhizophagus irregularis DAOM 181602=DAOM 197198]
MCVNSCCAFVGVLENERKCKFCKEDRYYSNGPKQPQDFNSFLYPLIQEMKLLQDGILCYDGNKKEYFTLRAHILAWTGDLPALSKILYLTGHNSYSGCRFCNLRGTLNEMNRHVYYPLQQNIDSIRLPIRTHDEMLTSINQIEHLKGDRRETYIRNCGIKGKSILFELSSIKFPRSFPVDINAPFFSKTLHLTCFDIG